MKVGERLQLEIAQEHWNIAKEALYLSPMKIQMADCDVIGTVVELAEPSTVYIEITEINERA